MGGLFMDKKWFLQRLRFALWGGYNRSERKDIIADYESFFAQEQSNGLSEIDIITKLGDPTTVVLNLIKESGKPMPFGALIQKYSEHISFFMGAIVFFALALIFHSMRSYQYEDMTLVTSGIICSVIMIISLYFALKAKMKETDFRQRYKKIIISNAVLFVLAIFCCVFFNSKASMDLAFWVLENFQPQRLTNGLSEIRMIIFLITMGIGIWAIIGVWRGKTEKFITAVHAVGFSIYLETVYKLWRVLSDIDIYWEQVAKTSLVYFATVILTIVFSFVISKHGKGAVKNG
jgi:uncharacterized membrane protein